MKKLSGIIAVLIALSLVFIPAYTFAAEEALPASSSNLSPSLISSDFSADKGSVSPGGTIRLDFTLKNTSRDIDIRNVNIRLSGGEALIVNSGNDSVYIDRINKNATASFSKTFYCSPQAESGVYPVGLSASFEYFDGGEKLSGTSEINYSVKVSASQQSTSFTPQLLISDFSFGGDSVNGGDVFDLDVTLKNNSKSTAVRNVIVKLSGGEAFVPAEGTDTSSIDKISSTAKISQKFKCQNSASSGVYPITLSVTYEYFEAGERVSQSAELSVSIPVVQPEKIEFGTLSLADSTVSVNEEQDCAFTVINSGKSAVSNGRIKLTDAQENELSSAYIGNIQAGEQFTSNYTLPVTFTSDGTQKLTLVFDYENENGDPGSVSREFSVTVKQEEDPYADLAAENDAQTTGENDYTLFYLLGGIAALIVIIVVAVVVKKRRKAKKNGEELYEEI